MSAATIDANAPLFNDLKETAKSVLKALAVFDKEVAKETKFSQCLEVCAHTLGYESWFKYRSRMADVRHLHLSDMFTDVEAVNDFFLDVLSNLAEVSADDRRLMKTKIAAGTGYISTDPGKLDALGILWRRHAFLVKKFNMSDNQAVFGYKNIGSIFATGMVREIQRFVESQIYKDTIMHDFWMGRTMQLMDAVVRALVNLRNEKGFVLNASSLADHMSFEKVMELAARTDLSKVPLLGIRGYLHALPGFKRGLPCSEQAPNTIEQHGYLQHTIVKSLNNLREEELVFNDPLADQSLYKKIHALSQVHGREDDPNVIAYLSGGKDNEWSSPAPDRDVVVLESYPAGKQDDDNPSNTINPFKYHRFDWLKSEILKNAKSGKSDWFAGFSADSRTPIWIRKQDARHHLLYAMAPGSSRVEAQIGLATSAFLSGSGCCIIDPSGDRHRLKQVRELVEACGRKDDLFVVDFCKDPESERDQIDMLRDLTHTEIVRFIKNTRPKDAVWTDEIEQLFMSVFEFIKFESTHTRPARLADSIEFFDIWEIWLRAKERFPNSPVSKKTCETIGSYFKSLPGFKNVGIYDSNEEAQEYHDKIVRKIFENIHSMFSRSILHWSEKAISFRQAIRDRKILMISLPPEDDMFKPSVIGSILVELLSVSATRELCELKPFLTILSDCERLFQTDQRMTEFAARMCTFKAPVSFGCASRQSLDEALPGNAAYSIFGNCGTKIETKASIPESKAGGIHRPIIRHFREGDKIEGEISPYFAW